MSLILGIAAELSAPPSSPTSYREVCMYAATVRGYDVVALSPEDMIAAYRRWFRVYGLMDYIEDIIPPGRVEVDVEIECVPHGRMTALNVAQVLALL